jgi:hypothetical protein
MIRPHILADYQIAPAPDSGAAEFALLPRIQAFPREIAGDLSLKKPGACAPPAPLDVGGDFPQVEW